MIIYLTKILTFQRPTIVTIQIFFQVVSGKLVSTPHNIFLWMDFSLFTVYHVNLTLRQDLSQNHQIITDPASSCFFLSGRLGPWNKSMESKRTFGYCETSIDVWKWNNSPFLSPYLANLLWKISETVSPPFKNNNEKFIEQRKW